MTLTEQWKKGEPERGRYYIKYRGNYMSDNWHGDCWEDSWSEYVEEVLASVPSYEEWKSTGKFAMEAIKVAEENQQLKELLRECRDFVELVNIIDGGKPELLTKIDNAIGEKK
jgi:hypothetical protein